MNQKCYEFWSTTQQNRRLRGRAIVVWDEIIFILIKSQSILRVFHTN